MEIANLLDRVQSNSHKGGHQTRRRMGDHSENKDIENIKNNQSS